MKEKGRVSDGTSPRGEETAIRREALFETLRIGAWSGVLQVLLAASGQGLQTPVLQLPVVLSGVLMAMLWPLARRFSPARRHLPLWQGVVWGLALIPSAIWAAAWVITPVEGGRWAMGGLLLALLPLWYRPLAFGALLVVLAGVWTMLGAWPEPPGGVAALGVLWLLAWSVRARLRRQARALHHARGRWRALDTRLADERARHTRCAEARAQCEQALQEARAGAEAAGRAKTEFLATISHEIRTPLNGILPTLDLLRDTRLDEEQKRYVRAALNSSRHLLRIINDILDYAKAESGKLHLERIELNLPELVDGVLELMAGGAERKGLWLRREIAADVPKVVRGDPIRLRQILANLVSNAIKFTERGGVEVRIELRRATRREVELRFSVVDTGVGLSREQARYLFDSFTQADASTTRKHGGTGLGLAICRRLVELMGGRIGVRSRPGAGATFWFEIPLRRSIHDVPTQRQDLTGARALVVAGDDDGALARLLQDWGMQVETAPPGSALARVRERAGLGRSWAFEALVIDSRGIESRVESLLRALRADPALRELPVIVATRSETLARRLRERFGVQVLPGVPGADVLRPLLHRVFDVADSGTYEAAHEDLVGYLDLNVEEELSLRESASDEARGAATDLPPGLRVLLVEDNPVNSGVMRRVLARMGADCVLAENGQEALERLRGGGFDLVLMDCQMPVMDGYEATRAWREHERAQGGHLPIVAMTANAMQGDREKCLRAGMDDYLAKPVDMDALRATLARWTQGEAASDTSVADRAAAPADTSADGGAVLDEAVLDELREVMEDGFAALVSTWLETAPELVERLRRAAGAEDVEGMVSPAHSLKSSSANMGAMRLSEAAREVEFAAREGRREDALAAWRRVESEYPEARRALERLRDAAQSTSDA